MAAVRNQNITARNSQYHFLVDVLNADIVKMAELTCGTH
jgi:hypothetical protein